MDHHAQIVIILTVGFAAASLLGFIAERFKMPSMLGFLMAGFLIGPYSPGFVADLKLAEQLAEIGVILMLFGVGLHFKLEDLSKFKKIAIPGALVQTIVAASVTTFALMHFGWSVAASSIMGFSVGVASTVVLVRMLSDFKLLTTPQGHIAVAWLIVEDIMTVAILVLLPLFSTNTTLPTMDVLTSIAWLLLRFTTLALIIFTFGHKVVDYLLTQVARLRSHELLTLSVLATTFLIATASAYFFGASIALGAFLAGMTIGKCEVKHQAAANALPLKDVFSSLFFLTVGMLFNPTVIVTEPLLFLGILAVILLIKPITAFLLVLGFNYPVQSALTIAIALAQIGEFSFILAEQALERDFLPDTGYDILVACAIVSIALNPLLFRLFGLGEKRPKIATFLRKAPDKIASVVEHYRDKPPEVIVVGFGPIGQAVNQSLESLRVKTTIVEQNIDTIPKLRDQKLHVIYGDAAHPNILESCHIGSSKLLVITIPEIGPTVNIIKSARLLNPKVHIIARANYLADAKVLEDLKVRHICSEKESAKAFKDLVTNILKYL